MKIGLFSDTYLPQVSGVSTSVEFTFKNLLKRKYDVSLITAEFPKCKREKNILRIASLPVNRVFNYRFGILTPKVFIRLLRKKFDIIHGHAVGPISLIGLMFSRIKKIPYVYTYHTMMSDYAHYVPLRLIRPKMIDKIAKVSCNKCDYIIVPSNKVKNDLLSLGVKKPIEVIPTGVKTDKFIVSKKDFLRKKFNLKASDRILLHAGRLGQEKSVDFLIYAFRIILEKNPNAHLVIVGGGPQLTYLKALSERLKIDKNVHFTGVVKPSQMPIVYNSGEIFIFSSTTETQGLVVLEAMASGLTIVAVKDKALMETLENNINGILVSKDTFEFAKQVLRLLEDAKTRVKLGKNARKKAVLVSKQSIDNLERVYKKLIKGIKASAH